MLNGEALHAVEVAFVLMSRTMFTPADQVESDWLDVWHELSPFEQFMAVGVILGVLHALANDLDHVAGMSVQEWLSRSAAAVYAGGLPGCEEGNE